MKPKRQSVIQHVLLLLVALAIPQIASADEPYQSYKIESHSQSDAGLDGEWITYPPNAWKYGFRISGDIGVATISNSPKYKVGDDILRITKTSPTTFHGHQICTDGNFYPVTGTLLQDGRLEMQISGCYPTNWMMVRKQSKNLATEVLPIPLPISDEQNGIPPTFSVAPPIPYEDPGACPFECCTYRRWIAKKDTEFRLNRDASSPALFNVKTGEWISALTGVVITTKPGKAKVVRPITIDGVQAKKGDTVYILTYQGEGQYKIWYRGKIGAEWVLSSDDIMKLGGSLEFMQVPESTWWVQVKNNKGQVGWSKEPDNFDNRDACGGDVVEVEECDKNALMSALHDPSSNKITIFIDGIDFKVFLTDLLSFQPIEKLFRGPWPTRDVNYLCKSPLANTLKLKVPSVHGAIVWNGDLEDDVDVEGAIGELQTSILQLARADKQIDLITHSYGAVIAYIALARIAEKSYARPIANLVTLASPMGQEKFWPWIGQLYPSLNIPSSGKILPPNELHIGKWLNAYAKEDLIGGRIGVPGVINIFENVPDAKPWAVEDSINHRVEAHSAPYSNPSIYKRVIDHLKASYSSVSGQVRNDWPLKSETKYQKAASTANSKAKKDTRAGCNKGSSVLSPSIGGAQGALKKFGTGTDGCIQ
jgi:hypothetical protein